MSEIPHNEDMKEIVIEINDLIAELHFRRPMDERLTLALYKVAKGMADFSFVMAELNGENVDENI